MRGASHEYRILSTREEETLHANVLRIIDQVGLKVESNALLERMAAIGGRVDRAQQRVTFSPAATEEFIESSEHVTGRDNRPRFAVAPISIMVCTSTLRATSICR